MESLEAKHGARDPFYETVVLLQNVIEILDLSDRDEVPRPGKLQDHVHCHQAGQINAAFVDDRTIPYTICSNGLLENLRAAARSRRSDCMKSRA